MLSAFLSGTAAGTGAGAATAGAASLQAAAVIVNRRDILSVMASQMDLRSGKA